MARPRALEKMSYSELAKLRNNVDQLMAKKQAAERAELRDRVVSMAKEHGLSIQDLFSKGRKGKGSVAIKYRDPSNPANTWTGRGRTPRWMVAATKGGKAKKEDFLI